MHFQELPEETQQQVQTTFGNFGISLQKYLECHTLQQPTHFRVGPLTVDDLNRKSFAYINVYPFGTCMFVSIRMSRRILHLAFMQEHEEAPWCFTPPVQIDYPETYPNDLRTLHYEDPDTQVMLDSLRALLDTSNV